MPPQVANKNPLYAQVHKILLDRLLAREWKPGEKLPSESELAHQCGVSLGTLRHAVDLLVSENILVRREGVGTFVSTYCTAGYWNRFQPFETVLASDRYDLRRLVRFEVMPAPEEASRALGLPAETPVIHIVRHMLRTKKDADQKEESESGAKELTSIDELYLRPQSFAELNEAFLLTRFLPSDSLYKFYDREFGIVITRQKCTVSCERIEGALQETLCLSAPLDVLRLSRISYAFSNDPVEYRIYRADARTARLCFDLN